MRLVAILVSSLMFCLAGAAGAVGAEQFVVVHVEPPVPDIVAGTTYGSDQGSPEFIFVPANTKVVLLGEDGTSYLIAGREAVEASRERLKPFEMRDTGNGRSSVLELLFGGGQFSGVVAASRRLGKAGASPAAGDDEPLPLYLEMLAHLNGPTKYCMFSGTLAMRRIDPRFLDRITVEAGGAELSEDWRPGADELRFRLPGLPEGKQTRATIIANRGRHEFALARLPASALDAGRFTVAARLAKVGCTLQAAMFVDGFKQASE